MSTDSTAYYLRPAELAAQLRVTTRTLGRWRRKGSGPAFIQEGRVIRYRSVDLDSWAATGH